MFAEERIRKIKEILIEYEHVDINTLSSLLNASVTTVRRDLDRLENEGFLKKAHGGAILIKDMAPDIHSYGGNVEHVREKKLIAELAARYVDDNDVIFLGSGHIPNLIARELGQKKNLQVVTDNLQAAFELSVFPGVKVYAAGGEVEALSDSVIFRGSIVEEQVSRFFFKKAFLSFTGASLRYGYTHDISSEIPVIRNVLEHTADSVAVMDFSRFDAMGFRPVCGLDEISTVITNVNIPDDYKEYYLSHGIRIFTGIEDVKI